jgi:hypothetical protein
MTKQLLLCVLALAVCVVVSTACGGKDQPASSNPATPPAKTESGSTNSAGAPGAASLAGGKASTAAAPGEAKLGGSAAKDAEAAGDGASSAKKDEPGAEKDAASGDKTDEGKDKGKDASAGSTAKPGEKEKKVGEDKKVESSDEKAAAAEKKDGKDDEKVTDEEAAKDEKAGKDDKKDSAEAEEDKLADPIDQFKALDPREIIDRKYKDLKEQHTEPWDEEDPDQFIPDTGRVDPLTQVREAIPDALKPKRAGETDENDILSYFIARDATLIVYQIAYNLQCYNVIQIGIEKQVTMGVFGNMFLLREGDTAGPFGVGYSGGVPLVATMTCTAINTNEVDVIVTVAGQGTSTAISKSQTFIPRSYN